jgi:spore coat protein SA
MNIAIILPGVLPVPSLKGGAVETLIDYLIEYNELNPEHEITIFGVFDNVLTDFDFSHYKHTHLNLLNQKSCITKLDRLLFKIFKWKKYYNYYLDYFAYNASKEIGSGHFDMVIVENRPGFILPISMCTSAKIVLHLHNDSLYKDTKEANTIVDACFEILTVSNYLKRRVSSIASTNKVSVVYNGIDLERFLNPESSGVSRADWGLSNDDFVVVFTGRITPIKGVRELLQAFILLSEYPKIKLLLVGGSFNDASRENKFMAEMRQISSRNGNQILFTGFQPYEKIPSILSLCDIAVIPSICEDALTMTSLEDMAIGLPLVVTRSGGIPEAVDEKCAIIVDKDNELPSNLAEAILSLYNDVEKRLQMSMHAKKRSSLFSKQKYCETFFRKLKDL